MIINQTYAKFDEFIVVASGYIAQHWLRLGLTELMNAQVQIRFNRWTAIFYQYRDPLQRNDAVVHATENEYIEYSKFMIKLIKQIFTNTIFKPLPDDYIALDYKPRSHNYSASKIPVVPPGLEYLENRGGQYSMRLFDIDNPDAKSNARPKSVTGMRVEFDFAPVGAPAPDLESKIYGSIEVKRMRFTFHAPPQFKGQYCYMRVKWLGRRNQVSKPSAVIKFIIA